MMYVYEYGFTLGVKKKTEDKTAAKSLFLLAFLLLALPRGTACPVQRVENLRRQR